VAAAAAFDAVPEPVRAAYARYREAEATLAVRGSREEAGAALVRAAVVADEIGALPLRRAIDDLAMRARIDLSRATSAAGAIPAAVPAPGHDLGLTARETEILGIVAHGRTNRQIAEELFITEKTVGVHMTNILGKLGVASRMDAAAIADRLGIGRRPERSTGASGDGAASGGGDEGGHQRLRRAFLFTDIVRSTDLIGVIGDDAWVDLLRWHDERLRAVFAGHRGEEVDHAGDGFLVSFERSADALDCAVEIQRALADHRRHHGFAPSVRIGVHASEASRSGTGFAGRAVHEGSRIAGLAGPDEILASLETVRDGPARSGVSPPRTVRLKGIGDPVAIVTVGWRRG
jgi:class 3 adenylate cyclase